MVFESLYESALKGELILVEGGICRYHVRKDGQLTIREIISTRPGAGQEMLNRLLSVQGINKILAKCPEDLGDSCEWYKKRGFVLDRNESTASGRGLKVFVLEVKND